MLDKKYEIYKVFFRLIAWSRLKKEVCLNDTRLQKLLKANNGGVKGPKSQVNVAIQGRRPCELHKKPCYLHNLIESIQAHCYGCTVNFT